MTKKIIKKKLSILILILFLEIPLKEKSTRKFFFFEIFNLKSVFQNNFLINCVTHLITRFYFNFPLRLSWEESGANSTGVDTEWRKKPFSTAAWRPPTGEIGDFKSRNYILMY